MVEDNQNGPILLDDALSMTKFGKFNVILMVLSGTILSATILETVSISFIVPVACDLDLTTSEKGLLSAIAIIGVILSSLLWGFLADTKGRKRIILPSLLVSFIFSALSSFAPNFTVLVVLRFLTGFFISGSSANIYAYLGEFHNQKICSRAIMGASVIYGIGSAFPAIFAWIIINQEWSLDIPIIEIIYKPWRLYMLVCALPGLICSFILLKMPESPKFTLGLGKQEETIEILKTVYSMNTGKSKDMLQISSIIEESPTQIKELNIFKSIWAQISPIFSSEYLRSSIIACVLQFVIYATAQGMLLWFPHIVNKVADHSEMNQDERISVCEIIGPNTDSSDLELCDEKLNTSSFLFSCILEVIFIIGFGVIGMTIHILGKLTYLLVILVVSGVSGVLLVFIDVPTISICLYVILLLSGLACSIVNAASIEIYPTKIRAMAVCIFLTMGRIGSVVGTNFFGILIDFYCDSVFYVSGISLIFCGILSIFIPNISKREQN